MAAAFASFALMPLGAGAAGARRFTLTDLVKVSQYLAGKTQLTEQQIQQFDLTGDGKVTLSDLVQMARDFEQSSSPTQAPTTEVSEQAAREYALSLVPGAVQSDILSCRLDRENGVSVYDVEIAYDGAKYEFDIATTKTGSGDPAVYKQSMERNPTPGYQGTAQTEQSAKDIVLARVPGAAATDFTEFKKDTDDGVRVYEGTLFSGGKKYEFEIVQATGEVISWSEEMTTLPQAPVAPVTPAPTAAATAAPAGPTITLQQAQQLALERVPGAVQSDIVSSQLDDSDLGIEVYDIELHHNGVRYDYTFSRAGALIKESIEWPYDSKYQGSVQTEQSAQQVALGAVPGANTSNITGTKLDTEDGVQVYDIDLVYNGQKWSFEIAQPTGQILEQSMELLAAPGPAATTPAAQPSSGSAVPSPIPPTPAVDTSPGPAEPTPAEVTAAPQQTLSAEQAQQIVLAQIPGASLSNITSTEQDTEDGIPVYDVEVRCNGATYEYKVTTYGTVFAKSMEHPVTPGYQGTPQTEQSAKDIAAGFVAGAAVADVTSCKLDTEDGILVYDIDLVYYGEKWSFEIVQSTGEMISWSMDTIITPVNMPTVSATAVSAPTAVIQARHSS